MAIETTGALPIFFPSCSSITPRSVPQRLQLFNAFRHSRVTTTQLLSNTPPHTWSQNPTAYDDMLRQIRKYYDGNIPPRTARPWGEEFRDWFFSYDVIEQAEEFLKDCETEESIGIA